MENIRVPDDWRFGRVREDIDSGRLWKARDRLQGHLSTDHADQDVLDVLGSVWFAMGDLPQAGRHWFLAERSDAAASAAREAFYERFSHDAGNVLRALPRPAEPAAYPAAVRARLEELTSASGGTVRWYPSGWKPATYEFDESLQQSRRDAWLSTGIILGVVALLLIGALTVASWLVGLVT